MWTRTYGRLVVAVALASTLVACSSSASTPITSASSTASPSGSSSAKVADAGKSPVSIGVFYQGAGTSGAAPEVGPALDAAIAYINNDLNGLDGHPLKLDKCVTDGTPTSTQSCAQKLVANKPVLVLDPTDFNPGVASPIIGGAGLVAFATTEIAPADYKDPNFFFTTYGNVGGALSNVLGILQQVPNAKKVGLFAPDIAPIAAAVGIIKSIFQSHGVTLSVSQFPVSATDLIGPWQALKSSSLDAVMGLLPQPFCASSIKAAKDAGNTKPVFTTALCASPQIAAQTNNGGDGWIVATTTDDPLGTTPDATLYQQQMKKYAGNSADLGGFADFGFQLVLQVYQAIMKPLGFDHLSTAELKAQAAKPSRLFLGGGVQMACGKSTKLPATCDFTALLSTVKGGNFTAIPNATIDMQSTLEGILAP